MVDVSIVKETSPEAYWNRQTDKQIGKPMCKEAAPPKSSQAYCDQDMKSSSWFIFEHKFGSDK